MFLRTLFTGLCNLTGLIAVCMYHLVMISIVLSETAHFVHWKSERTSETIFFLTKNLVLNFVLDYILQLYFACNHLICLIIQCGKNVRSNTRYVYHAVTPSAAWQLNCRLHPQRSIKGVRRPHQGRVRFQILHSKGTGRCC